LDDVGEALCVSRVGHANAFRSNGRALPDLGTGRDPRVSAAGLRPPSDRTVKRRVDAIDRELIVARRLGVRAANTRSGRPSLDMSTWWSWTNKTISCRVIPSAARTSPIPFACRFVEQAVPGIGEAQRNTSVRCSQAEGMPGRV
jgi:hypothetical protein